MKIAAAQIRLKTADFEFNLKNIIKAIENTDCDLIIFPKVENLGAKSLCYDKKFLEEQEQFYERIAERNFSKNILLGDILIQNGEILYSNDGFYNIGSKKIFVSDTYCDDAACDLYVLAANRYFAINSYTDIIKSLAVSTDFVYINALCMADSDIYDGRSFAKNSKNELVLQMPSCTEDIKVIDFSKRTDFYETPMEQQVIDVTTFALKEYCENTGFKKVIFGLSGGIDSALTAVLAAKAIGSENVLGVLMPSMYSSEGSITDSLKLAQNLGIKIENHSITPLFENFMNTIVKDERLDLAEENLQARLRALILMFFSNRENYLLLSTGNKSEAAMGYGTLYGDMAGGLNLMSDLTKTNVYKVVNYINKDTEIIPHKIIEKAPSAELRPNQKDQDSLPEYEILDDIIEMYIEQCLSYEEIYSKHGKDLVDDIIKRIKRTQFKRAQSCLGIRLTKRTFSDVRFPIAM